MNREFDPDAVEQRLEIPGVGIVTVPTDPTIDDFPNMELTQEEICLKLHLLERRIANIERELGIGE